MSMPVGLRIAHGEMFQESALIDDRVLRGIDDCVDPMDALLNTQIRLLGISGLTNDVSGAKISGCVLRNRYTLFQSEIE